MDKTAVFTLLFLTSCCTGLQVGIRGFLSGINRNITEDSLYMVKSGQQLQFICYVNRGSEIISSLNITWVHVSLVDPRNPVETVLTSNENLQSGVNPDLYGTRVAHSLGTLSSALFLYKVQSSSDGNFICRVSGQGETVEAEANVIVGSDVQSLELMFDDEDVVMGEDVYLSLYRDARPVKRKPSIYNVTCQARGFNPSARVFLYLGWGEELPTGGTFINRDMAASQKAGARRYVATASATNVILTVLDSGKELNCLAKADYDNDDAAILSARIILTIVN